MQKDYIGTEKCGSDTPKNTGETLYLGSTSSELNNPVPVSLLSGDRKPQIRFLGNHHSGSGNLYHKSFRM